MVDIETILTSLYANEVNISLAWNTDRGFWAVLGDPVLAKKRFKSSGEAVRWLKEQALQRFPEAKFARERNRARVDAEAILDDLYASQIDGSIEWIWDGGFVISLGGQNNAKCWSLKTVADAVEWLREEACRRYPETEFARKYGGFV